MSNDFATKRHRFNSLAWRDAALRQEWEQLRIEIVAAHRDLEPLVWKEAKERYPHSLVFIRRYTGGAVTFGEDAVYVNENRGYATMQIEWGDFYQPVEPTLTEREEGLPEIFIPGDIEDTLRQINLHRIHETWQNHPAMLISIQADEQTKRALEAIG